eukprot:TRINITY_DN21002_c0_g1_i1.p1 TRINITY_DN21002_c0_g1~~TRINITY_DN21002_c0_g1_i1.p1  ORF type:complete len:148 (+),score=12.21 TRINITY_DN21002_c0_g1_i1:203-646(+)
MPMLGEGAASAVTILVGLANVFAGGFCVYEYGKDKPTDTPKIFLSMYLAVFGLLVIVTCIPSVRVKLTTAPEGKDPLFGCLASQVGRAFFVFFVGTLGLGFEWHDDAKHLIPFFTGIATVAVALLVTCVSCCVNQDKQTDADRDGRL